MTLDEAIKHAEEIAEKCEFDTDWGIGNHFIDRSGVADIIKCAEEHRQLAEWLKELKQLREQTKWIPVSEKLPEDIKPVIVTWKNTDPKSYYQYIVGKHFIGTAHYKGGKWFWYSSVTEDLLAEYGRCDSEEFDEAIEVIAWMPLPQPYEPQESEDKE